MVLSTAADPVARARLLAQIREAVLTGAPAPAQPRPVVSESWRRSLAARVDPEHAGPPTVYQRGEMAELRAGHPLAEALPVLRETLVSIADEATHMMIVTDASGHILWREGQLDVLRRADRVGLIEGTRWSEDVIGTNAMGTALAEGTSVAIHSAEHLVRRYHAWTCAASPVCDPDTGRIVGVVDVTGPMRGFHPATIALVGAAAKLAEEQLRDRMRAVDLRLRARWLPRLAALRGEPGALVSRTGRVLASVPYGWLPGRLELAGGDPANATLELPDGRTAVLEPLVGGYLLRMPGRHRARAAGGTGVAGVAGTAVGAGTAERPVLELRFLGTRRPVVRLDGRELRPTRRHADMLTLLALNPSGITAEALATGVYGDRGNPVTARAEIHRLRARLGARVLRSNPYRLHAEVSADFLTVREELSAGRLRAAAAAYRGALRPDSEAPAVTEERQLLLATLRRSVLDGADAEAMWLLAETDAGATDAELAATLAAVLPPSDPRRAPMAARAAHLA
jgi:hypothetical protein